ncbi:amidohydrolase family protein [Polaribacter pacificus]|nr:amidohydrolase family protein [Polaribacter pacificus]
MKKQLIYSILFICMIGIGFAQQTPGSKQTAPFSIEGATAHLGDGTVIENSLIMVSDGKISFVGSANMRIARMGKVINAKGKHVYPGFIVSNTTLGLGEIDAVKASIDEREIGAFLPHIRSIVAYNAESKVVESMRPNGVLMGQITPRGGMVSGTSSLVQFDAWNWEDAIIKADEGIHASWPNSLTFGRWWLGEDNGAKANPNYTKSIALFKEKIENAKTYLAGPRNPKNLVYEAMEGLLNGTTKLYVHVDGQKEIIDAVNFAKDYGIKLVIVNGDEAYKVADVLVKNNVPVIVQRAHRIPGGDDSDYDFSYKLAKLLVEKGVTVAIGMDGDMERMSARNLPFYAGTYAAYGLGKEEALKLITSNPAKILGVEDRVGTLAVGKDATLFISEGDALDMRTNVLSHAFIQGRTLSLESHQTTLWKRYANKYKNQ